MKHRLALLVALITWSVLILVNARFEVDKGKTIFGIHQPGIAMQFARSYGMVTGLLGNPIPKQPEEEQGAQRAQFNFKMMREQQYLDFVFIALYSSFFVFVLSSAMRKSPSTTPWLGWLIVVCITLAALSDVAENFGILSALRNGYSNAFWPFPFAVTKWMSFFLAFGLVSPLFLRYPQSGQLTDVNPQWPPWPRFVVGLVFLSGSILGITGIILILTKQTDKIFNYAELALAIAFLSFLLLLLAAVGLLQSIRNNFPSWSLYLYALRVPLLACLFLILFPVLDLRSSGFATASRGILALENHPQLFFTGWLTLVACWLAMILTRVILSYGDKRFAVSSNSGSETPPPTELKIGTKMQWRTLFFWTMPSWPLLARVLSVADFHSSIFTHILALVGGFILAFVTLLATAYIHLHEKDQTSELDHALVMPLIPLLKRAYQAKPWLGGSSILLGLLSKLGPGYVDTEKGKGRVRSGHSLVAAFLSLLMLLYTIGYSQLKPRPQIATSSSETVHIASAGISVPLLPVAPNWFPVLCYVLILLMIGTSAGAGLSFLLDRYRFPVLTSIVLYSIVFNLLLNKTSLSSDHFYQVLPLSASHSATRLTPSAVLANWLRQHAADNRPLVVVTATGGGIQASAWTAKVLSGLEEQLEQPACKKSPLDRNVFGGSVALISAVSGGSVGSMYFAEHLAENSGSLPPPPHGYPSCSALPTELQARQSSLREAAWGLAYPDLLRAVFPLLAKKDLDRGWAIEQAWKRCWPGADRTLNGWSEALSEGAMPAVILNATTAETGQRFLLTNYQSPNWQTRPRGDDDPEAIPASSFFDLYPGYDLPVTTAARLSATFPFVTAMAKADISGQQRFHFADGGYYDNYGVTSAVEWLLQAIDPSSQSAKAREKKGAGRMLLWIEIEAFPKPDGVSAAELEKHLHSPDWDWINQLTAPVDLMLNVRTSGQGERKEVTLELLSELNVAGLSLKRIVFAFHDPGAPLSWHLTENQKQAIDHNWETWQQSGREKVKQAFNCF